MLRGILLDFNGVLVDDESVHQDLVRRVLAEEGVEIPASGASVELAGLDDRACFSRMLAAAGRRGTATEVRRLVARKASHYQQHVRRHGFHFFPGALELVESAARQGLMMGIVSGALREEIVQALHQASLRPHVKVVVTSEDVTRGKPAPDLYLEGLALLNAEPPLPERLLHPHEVLAVEDSPAGVEAAREAGLATLAVAHTVSIEELAEADLKVSSLAEIDPDALQQLYSEASRR